MHCRHTNLSTFCTCHLMDPYFPAIFTPSISLFLQPFMVSYGLDPHGPYPKLVFLARWPFQNGEDRGRERSQCRLCHLCWDHGQRGRRITTLEDLPWSRGEEKTTSEKLRQLVFKLRGVSSESTIAKLLQLWGLGKLAQSSAKVVALRRSERDTNGGVVISVFLSLGRHCKTLFGKAEKVRKIQ